MTEEIYSFKCKYCGREFKALYEKQAKNNRDIHELTCPKLINRKNKEEEEDEKK